MQWSFPLTTGTVCRLLSVPEHRLINLERLGKITVPTVCGRRAWSADLVLRAARLLDKDSPAVRNVCKQSVPPTPFND